MALNSDEVGKPTEPYTVQWTSDDALLYALAVGVAKGHDHRHLGFTTDNTEGFKHRVLPTFGATIVENAGRWPPIGSIDHTRVLHAGQKLTVYRDLPTNGSLLIQTTLEGLYDHQKSALAVYRSEGRAADTGERILSTESTHIIRGAGGFGGGRRTRSDQPMPSRAPELVANVVTYRDQALLYRLCGDRNRLHSDPTYAHSCGFEHPILHGLCTFGIAGSVLLDLICDYDSSSFLSISMRFSAPVFPGDRLTFNVWNLDQNTHAFLAYNSANDIVLNYGTFMTNA